MQNSMMNQNKESLNGYHFHTIEDAQSFLDTSFEFLHQREDLNATVIATAELILNGSPYFKSPYWFGAVRNTDSSVIGCAIHARPDGLTVAGVDVSLARRVFDWVSESSIVPRRVTSEPKFADSISRYWQQLNQKTIALEHNWNVYRLDATPREHTSLANGALQLAQDDEMQLVRKWGDWYASEKPAFLNIGEFFERKLKLGELLVWDDDGPTTIMALSARTKSGIRISGLYTPLSFRGKGYATSMVAEVCSRQLALGRDFITLSAQKGDPVEMLYRRLGFYQIGQRKSITYSD